MTHNLSFALFIIDNNKHVCNICSEEIEKDKVIGLKCDPKKHVFCYDCIISWYIQVNSSSINNYPIKNMCPVCRKNGGLIPVYKDDKPLKNINYTSSYIKNNLIIMNPDKLPFECGIKFMTSNNFCKLKGNQDFSGFCKKHMKFHELYVQHQLLNNTSDSLNNTNNTNNSIIIPVTTQVNENNTETMTETDLLINPNKLPHQCGIKYKSKQGYCLSLGKQLYGGYCGIHKINNLTINNNNIDLNINIDTVLNNILD